MSESFGAILPGEEPPFFESRETEVSDLARELVLLLRPSGQAAAAYWALASQVKSETRVIAVSGVGRGAGASVSAANLALALAEGGRRRVCLVDVNLHRPIQHRLFGLPPQEGLCELSSSEGKRRPTLARLARNLWLLGAGKEVSQMPARVLADKAVFDAIKYARGTYDVVVLDGPPLLESADLLVLSTLIDTFLLVVRATRTRRAALVETANRVPKGKLWGTILNDAPEYVLPRGRG